MADRPSSNLQGGGASMVAPPHSARGPSRGHQDMSLEEMEQALTRFSRRPLAAGPRAETSGTQTARALLAENQQLVLEKQKKKQLERQNSFDQVEKLLAEDRVSIETDKAKEISQRHAKHELARYYKAAIVDKEASKSNSYKQKLEQGIDSTYFPFVEGETIKRNREAQTEKMRDEMRSFLKKQREAAPPRSDALLTDVGVDHIYKYPPMQPAIQPRGSIPPASSAGGEEATAEGAVSSVSAPMQSGEVASHIGSRYPKFLSRSKEHMSRRIQDAHVRRALEDKVEQTKRELEAQTRDRHKEARMWEEGLLVNDALRYDSNQGKADERKKNAEFVLKQIEDRKARESDRIKDWREKPAGYWGPEEKPLKDQNVHRSHCSDLIAQMQVDQNRRLDERHRRLQQERRIVDNSIAEMSQDREREKVKQDQQKEVLTTTWKSQKLIRKAQNQIQRMG